MSGGLPFLEGYITAQPVATHVVNFCSPVRESYIGFHRLRRSKSPGFKIGSLNGDFFSDPGLWEVDSPDIVGEIFEPDLSDTLVLVKIEFPPTYRPGIRVDAKNVTLSDAASTISSISRAEFSGSQEFVSVFSVHEMPGGAFPGSFDIYPALDRFGRGELGHRIAAFD